MVFIIIAVIAVLVALGLWRLIAVSSRGMEEEDKLFEAWYKEHKKTDIP